MKFLQIAFITVLGSICFATYATSNTLHQQCDVTERGTVVPAPVDH